MQSDNGISKHGWIRVQARRSLWGVSVRMPGHHRGVSCGSQSFFGINCELDLEDPREAVSVWGLTKRFGPEFPKLARTHSWFNFNPKFHLAFDTRSVSDHGKNKIPFIFGGIIVLQNCPIA